MKRIYKGFAAMTAAAMVMLGSSVPVSAAGVRDVFDAQYYADTYEDLKAAFGYDEEALFLHYITCGLEEGRCASPVFDVAQYRNSYQDLDQAFGDDWDAYVDHYLNFGIAEGRTAGTKADTDIKKVTSNTDTDTSETDSNVQTDSLPPVRQEEAQTLEEAVYNALIAQKAVFPEGMRWTNDDFVAWQGGIYYGGYGCAGFAFALSDAAFSDAPARFQEDYDNIRVGDILRMDNDTHSVIVLEVKESSIVIAEGNYNSSVHWGREISKSKLQESCNYILTRYQD